jgi:DNA repair exonuclease SbcCD ATPase subunit
MTSELNPVRLQAENIDLRHKLGEAESRIEKLVVMVTQAAVHDSSAKHVMMSSVTGDDEFFRKLKTKVDIVSPDRDRTTKPQFRDSDAEAIKSEFDAFAERIKELEAALAKSSKQLDQSRKDARALDSRAGELEAERDQIAAALISTKQDLHAAVEAKDAAELELAMAVPTSQEAIDAEVKRQVEEGVFSATMDLEDQIDTLKSENEQLRATVAENLKVVAERDAATAIANEAVKERAIAVRVKDGAIEDAKKLRREIQELQATMTKLQATKDSKFASEMEALEARVNSAEEAKQQHIAYVAKSEADAAQRDAKAAEALARAAQVQARLAEAEATIARLKTAYKQADDGKAEAELRVSALMQRVAALSRERDSAVTQRDAAFGASEQRAQLQQREKDEAHQRHQDALKRLQAKFKDSSEVVKNTYQNARQVYDALIEKLQSIADAGAKEELICDVLYEYERRIWLLNADIASLRTVGDIRASDAESHLRTDLNEALSNAEMLRMQLHERGMKPCC